MERRDGKNQGSLMQEKHFKDPGLVGQLVKVDRDNADLGQTTGLS